MRLTDERTYNARATIMLGVPPDGLSSDAARDYLWDRAVCAAAEAGWRVLGWRTYYTLGGYQADLDLFRTVQDVTHGHGSLWGGV